MIKANELRLGNKIQVNGLHGDLFMTVSAITGKGTLNENKRVIFFEEDKEQVGEFLEHCYSIPLTPDILEKCGFDIDLNNFNWNAFKEFENNGLSHYVTLRFNEKRGWFFNHAASPVKHVHQLQNLYFVLTGEELEINL